MFLHETHTDFTQMFEKRQNWMFEAFDFLPDVRIVTCRFKSPICSLAVWRFKLVWFHSSSICWVQVHLNKSKQVDTNRKKFQCQVFQLKYRQQTCSLSSTAWFLAEMCSSRSLKAAAAFSFSPRRMGAVPCRRPLTLQSCGEMTTQRHQYNEHC